MTKQILVATTNEGKMRELVELLGNASKQIEWLSLKDFPNLPEVVEDGETFQENARRKALGYAQATGFWTIADDSGLVIDALDGTPGVKSARFSGEKNTERGLLDHKNMQKVLTLMKNVPVNQRTARFVCNLCMAKPNEVLVETEGKLEGIISEKECGENGFGYDPIFFLPDRDKTVAQLIGYEKNAISHRGNAIRKLQPLLAKLLAGKFQ